MATRYDLAVIGGGVGGLMLLWHRLRLPNPPRRVLWINDGPRFGRGPAYSTRWPQHLLNVPARNMGALPEQPEHFLQWLNSPQGREAATREGLSTEWHPTDYAPRLLYGAYLDTFHASIDRSVVQETLTTVTSITASAEGYELRSGTQSWHARQLALAMGNRPNPPWDTPTWHGRPHPGWLGRMWDWATQTTPLPFTDHALPALILGSGLTGVDAVLQLRALGWRGRVDMLSRHAALPTAHAAHPLPPAPAPDWPAPGARLSAYLHAWRQTAQDWRAAIDALRPHTPELWQRLSPADQRRFWTRLAGRWNTHRHRMAPDVAAFMARELKEGSLKPCAFPITDLRGTAEGIEVISRDGRIRRGALVVDCTGPSYDLARESGPLGALLVSGHIALAPNGLGLRMDDRGLVYPGAQAIVALGALAVGARWETTAMPELRIQAAKAALALSED